MKSTTYHVTMDDGTRFEILSRSASDAIQIALEKRIGHKVTACCIEGLHGGRTDFEIPNHDALVSLPERIIHHRKERLPDDHHSKRPAPWIEEWLANKSK